VPEYDQSIVDLALQAIGQHQPKSDQPPAETRPEQRATKVGEAQPDTTDSSKPKEIKTAAELAQMIEADLGKHPQCPREGFVVTVYGSTFWRAMLTITPAAGSIRNPQEWRDLTEDLAERLRKRYDLAWR
jgi:hypothetical protein